MQGRLISLTLHSATPLRNKPGTPFAHRITWASLIFIARPGNGSTLNSQSGLSACGIWSSTEAMTTRIACRWPGKPKPLVMPFAPTYLYAGMADIYAETGDEELWTPLERVWRNLVEKKMYITGGCGALHDGASPDGSKDQRAITRVHQAFGRNYQLPNATAHNETCANIGNVLWNWRMFLSSGEAKYIDVLELALYNSVLSGVGLSGTDYFYANPLQRWDEMPVDLRWSRSRVPFMTCFCCPPNVVRTIAEANRYAYGRSDGTIWINLYGSSTLDTMLADSSRIRLEQRTDYPWDGEIRITVLECGSTPVRLKLCIPGWAKSARLEVDGRRQK